MNLIKFGVTTYEKILINLRSALRGGWPTPNIWVFIAQLVEHCSANAEAINLQLLKLRL